MIKPVTPTDTNHFKPNSDALASYINDKLMRPWGDQEKSLGRRVPVMSFSDGEVEFIRAMYIAAGWDVKDTWGMLVFKFPENLCS